MDRFHMGAIQPESKLSNTAIESKDYEKGSFATRMVNELSGMLGTSLTYDGSTACKTRMQLALKRWDNVER